MLKSGRLVSRRTPKDSLIFPPKLDKTRITISKSKRSYTQDRGTSKQSGAIYYNNLVDLAGTLKFIASLKVTCKGASVHGAQSRCQIELGMLSCSSNG